MVPTCALAQPYATTIEIDPLDPSGGILVTLRTDAPAPAAPVASVVALVGHRHLEELPELLRVVGLALVFDDPHSAHRAVGRLLADLAAR